MKSTSSSVMRNFVIILVPVILISIGAVGFLNYQNQKELVYSNSEIQIKQMVSSGSMVFSDITINQIKDKSHFQSEYYNTVQKKLLSLKAVFGEENLSLNILRKKNNATEIVVGDENKNIIGQSYDFINEMDEALKMNITTSRWEKTTGETFVVGYAPINTNDIESAILLMIKHDISDNLPSLFTFFIWPGIFGVVLIILVILIGNIESKKINRSIAFTTSNLNRLGQGEYIKKPEEENMYLDEINSAVKSLEESLNSTKDTGVERDKIQKQITELLKIVSSAADGDFTVSANVTADTLGALADSFNLMINDLSDLVRDAKKAAEQVATSTEGILNNIDTMAHGAAEQASQTETISNSAKDMAKLITDTNQSAKRAAEAAHDAKSVADRGSEIVKKSILGMHNIRDSVRDASRQVRLLGEQSTRIGEISDFIGEIASRTNLLALNASIEAARAGDAGRGFSVVADEIRNLAERSSNSADEISKLIDDIQTGISKTMTAIENGSKEATEGTSLVDGAGEALREILGSVEISTTSAVEISNATQEQTKFSGEIVTTLEHIAGIAKETAEGAKQSKESATQLEYLSKNLNQAVAKFRLAQ